MKHVRTLFLCVCLTGSCALRAQGTPATDKPLIPVVKLSDNVSVKFGGFVRAEYYIDSRETVGAVDDLFGFFPENKLTAPGDGKDQNAVVRQNLSTQATRFNALFTGPDAFKAKSTAYFEYDFTGGAATQTATGATNPVGFRLRHAWMKLSGKRTEWLLGKTWNPLGETIFPSVVGLHTGIPFRPFGRGDQLRVTYKASERWSVLAAALFQTEHKSTLYTDGSLTAAAASTNDVRSNPYPDLHLQVHYRSKNLFAGLVSEFKTLRPCTLTTGTAGTYRSTETVSSGALGVFADYKLGLLNVKGSGIFGQNLSELFQQGGYAVASYNALTGARTYTVSNSVSTWLNATYGTRWMVGLFGGYQKNLGFSDDLASVTGGPTLFMGRWQNIDHVYRVAPSLTYAVGRWKFQTEVDYNIAGYGTVDPLDKGKVKNAKDISGSRLILASTFQF